MCFSSDWHGYVEMFPAHAFLQTLENGAPEAGSQDIVQLSVLVVWSSASVSGKESLPVLLLSMSSGSTACSRSMDNQSGQLFKL